ncbi:MAG: Hsp33 family molecular chaperone HslO [Spirochaetales bacterium]|nr:Hsp33 family molecular chaperone HslO [Spirochaetales bacterium]
MIKKRPFGADLREQLEASARDRLHHFILDYGGLRGAFVCGTRMVNEMRANHELGQLETLVLGHAYLAAALMSSNLKAPDRLQLQVTCSGPVGGLSVEANAFGEVRGYLQRDGVPLPDGGEALSLPGLLGSGVLSVTRHLQDAKQPFTGQVELLHGTLAQDLAHYYLVSEQTPAALSLSVKFGAGGAVASAGGLLLQRLPEARPDAVAGIEELFGDLPSIGERLAAGQEAEALVREWFGEFSPLFLGSRRVAFMCHCSGERFGRFLSALPAEELRDMLEHGTFPVVTTCVNCNTAYEHSREEVEGMFRRAGR